jgi:hypothetical protein
VYYLLLHDVVDQFAERRTPYRDAHLKLARAAAANGELLLGGAFADPVDGAALAISCWGVVAGTGFWDGTGPPAGAGFVLATVPAQADPEAVMKRVRTLG